MKKLLCLSAVVGIVATSQASFEMVLVAQDHTLPNVNTTTKIGRWDPQNGVFLGYFGAGIVRGTAISIDPTQSNTVADVYGSNGSIFVQRFNYSTGENLGLTTFASTGSNQITDVQMLANSRMLLAGSFNGALGVRAISNTGSITQSYQTPSGTNAIRAAFQNSAGVTFVLSRQSGTTSGSKFTLTSYAVGSGAIASTATIADNFVGNFDNLIQSENNVIVGATALNNRQIIPVSGTTLGTNINSGGFTNPSEVIFSGHGSSYYSMGFELGSNRIYLNTMSGTSIGTYTIFESTQYGPIYDAAMVVAPEPMTMVGLGLGLAAMLRRRKGKNLA